MIPASRTSIVYNNPSKLLGVPPYYYRLRNCDTNLTSNTPANQYQRLKLIQNTVQVYAALYTANLGPLSAYKKPGVDTHNVCWNQMSDRPYPSVQKTVVPSGANCTLNRKHTSVTSSKPGNQSPGGIGCDIKHNCYDRYLNRLKGKSALRRGVVPPNFGKQTIPFNPAFPIYGGKTTKTNIVSGCNCPVTGQSANAVTDNQIYNNPIYQPYPTSSGFAVGDYVFAKQQGNNYYTRAIIESGLDNGVLYYITFDNGVEEIQEAGVLLVYYPCNCNGIINSQTYSSGFLVAKSEPNQFNPTVLYPVFVSNAPVL